ncbi:hypothetical protein CsSME_00045890 [Camellia sinensis var. sinensis]
MAASCALPRHFSGFTSYLQFFYFSLAVEEWWLYAVQFWVAVGRVCRYHGDGCFKRLAMLLVGANQWSFFLFLFVHSCSLQFAYSYGLCRRFHVYFDVSCNRFFEQFGRMGPSWFITSVCLGYYFCIIFILLQMPTPTGCVGRFCGCDGAHPYGLSREFWTVVVVLVGCWFCLLYKVPIHHRIWPLYSSHG